MTVPVISRQIWNRWAISWRYSGAGRRWRLGRKGEGGTGAQAQEQEAHRIHEESQQRVCEPDEEAEQAWASSHSQGTPPNYRSLSLPIVAAEGRNVQSDEDGIFAEHREREARGDLSQQIMCTNLVWCDLARGQGGQYVPHLTIHAARRA